MKVARLIPLFVGLAVLLLGIYLVSTNGYVGGWYLPSLVGIQPCSSGSSSGTSTNVTQCGGIGLYGGYGVGTIVCLFGLGLLASSVRRAASSPGAGTGGSTAVPPEILAALAQAQSRTHTAPGMKPNTVYCSKCGAANLPEAKFCHQCASAMPVAPTAPTPATSS